MTTYNKLCLAQIKSSFRIQISVDLEKDNLLAFIKKNCPLIVKYAWLQLNLSSQARKIFQARFRFDQIEEEENVW